MDWVEVVVKIAAALGFNPVTVRWKLLRAQEWWRGLGRAADQKVGQITYKHKKCGACGHLVDRSVVTCPRCGAHVSAYFFQVLERIGLALPATVTVSMVLIGANIAAYARVALASGPKGFMSFNAETLYAYGAHFPPAVHAGEWWRLGTAIFLHVGLWHILFNMMALAQIGPAIEEIYGRARMLFFYMLTGVVANVGSELFGLHAVSAGASGAIMGLCGIAAGWGQRDGTTIGRDIRNRMLKWGLYTLAFGFFIGADNAAHFWGFAAGGAIGYTVKPAWLRLRGLSGLGVLMGLLGLVSATLSVALVIAPLPSKLDFKSAFAQRRGADAGEYYRRWKKTCALHAQGKPDAALEEFKRMVSHRRKLDVGPQVLDGVCAELAKMQDLCASDDLKGYMRRLPKNDEGDDEGHDVAEIGPQFKFICSHLKE